MSAPPSSPTTPKPSPPSPGRIAGLAPGHPWQLGLGLIAWSVWFVVVYGGLSVGCAVAPPAPESRQFNILNGMLLLLTLVLVLWLVGAARTCARAARRPADVGAGADAAATARFIAHAAAWLHGIAAGAAVFVGLPLLALGPCV